MKCYLNLKHNITWLNNKSQQPCFRHKVGFWRIVFEMIHITSYVVLHFIDWYSHKSWSIRFEIFTLCNKRAATSYCTMCSPWWCWTVKWDDFNDFEASHVSDHFSGWGSMTDFDNRGSTKGSGGRGWVEARRPFPEVCILTTWFLCLNFKKLHQCVMPFGSAMRRAWREPLCYVQRCRTEGLARSTCLSATPKGVCIKSEELMTKRQCAMTAMRTGSRFR